MFLFIELNPKFARRPEPTGVDIWRRDTFMRSEFWTRVLHHFHHARACNDRFLASHCITHAEVLTHAKAKVPWLL